MYNISGCENLLFVIISFFFCRLKYLLLYVISIFCFIVIQILEAILLRFWVDLFCLFVFVYTRLSPKKKIDTWRWFDRSCGMGNDGCVWVYCNIIGLVYICLMSVKIELLYSLISKIDIFRTRNMAMHIFCCLQKNTFLNFADLLFFWSIEWMSIIVFGIFLFHRYFWWVCHIWHL